MYLMKICWTGGPVYIHGINNQTSVTISNNLSKGINVVILVKYSHAGGYVKVRESLYTQFMI